MPSYTLSSTPSQSRSVVQGVSTVLKSLPPRDMNWSPTCNVLPPQIRPFAEWKKRWRTETPRDLSPTSSHTSFPPLKQQNGIAVATGCPDNVRCDASTASSRLSRVNLTERGTSPAHVTLVTPFGSTHRPWFPENF